AYYIAIEDVNGTLSNVMPIGANASNPNIPYFIMVGFDKIFTDDFDVTSGTWQEGLASDGATTGIWEQNVPEQTDISGTTVQPDFQVTPGGAICYVTGGTAGGTAGANDVDGGATTLTSPVYDLSNYTNPTFEYYRWYTNDQGATPGTDYWQVYVSNNGSTYVPVENTTVSDHSWRRFVFRLNDYITPSSTVTVRFVAEDATPGSLIEALMDEFSLYDELTSTGINEAASLTSFSVWPNPADDYARITLVSKENQNACELQIIDPSGRLIDSRQVNIVAGTQDLTLSTRALSNGIYQIRILSLKGLMGTRKLSVMR
ncbi:MAG: T9SS type A sorting domain-containing protein, partial [Bacteroidota bacterium]